MKNRYIKIGLLALVITASSQVSAQVKVGDNPQTVNADAALEIESTDKGLILPRIALTSTTSAVPMTAHVEGMTVYNTATAGTGETAVVPGYYYNDGTKWVKIATGTDAKDEPWRVQNTTNEATANNDNIYQQGKVAVGFESTDAVSDKQLEVKGDFKTEAEVAGRFVGLETNMQGSGISMWYNANDELINGPDDMGMIQLLPNSVHLIAQSPTNIAATQIAPGTVEYRVGNWGLTDGIAIHHMDKDQIFLSSGSGSAGGNADLTNLYVRKGQGILFSHTDASGDRVGEYTFPRNAGQVGQVLGVETSTSDISTLAWKDINDLVDVTEPWRIQNTTNDAIANTDDIYQQGKVAVGFTDADAVSEKQLEVKGDFKSQVTLADGTVLGTEINNNVVDPTAPINISYVADNADVLSSTQLSMNMMSKLSNTIATKSGDKNTMLHMTSDAGLLGRDDFATGDQTYIGIHEKLLTLAQRDNESGGAFSIISLNKERGFTYEYNGATSANYTFPNSNPTEGQVLVGTNNFNGIGSRILEWQDPADLVKAAMPKFFYMPSVEIPTHNTSTGALLTGTQTINLYESYTEQFGFTGGVGQVRSNSSSTIPTLPANELDYFITYFDTDVFENVSVTDLGVLTYSVKSGAIVTPRTFMNIVFKVRD